MKDTYKNSQLSISEDIANLNDMSTNDMKQAQNEYNEIEPLIMKLKINPNFFNRRQGVPIDFELNYMDKRIALEVTDVRPYLEFFKSSKAATEKVVENVIRNIIAEDKISYFQIDIILKECTYCTKRLKTNSELKKEVKEYLENGYCKEPQFIESLFKREYSDVNIPKDLLSFNFQYEGILKKISTQCVINAINKKEKKLIKYKQIENNFDEYWLCIGLPLEERGFSISGICLEHNFKSGYQRIYITQQFPTKAILLYREDSTAE